ncbi:ImmA/IrrE family metallo-endopeptidase [Schaedlerella arabinosiphila]|uniref:ImmA/IrrE family metallo-endopeptidase n=1 Tax=Schaedlerella arabinosiphila TaxID=2044587 RepID=UPI002557DDB3|nr:ImmA/IrrE family metallo-endopeptidase [Schaedlerella arabinosiphila]
MAMVDYEMRKLIGDLTKDVIKAYNIVTPITDIERVVRTIGGGIRLDWSLGAYSDGSIRKSSDNSFEIAVSPLQPTTRKNFTIAHELGHLFLHMGYQIDDELWNQQDERVYFREGNSNMEYEANEFAAALLMPEDEYRKIMDLHTEGDLVDTGEIAKYFHVSVNAASNRGKWLGYLSW